MTKMYTIVHMVGYGEIWNVKSAWRRQKTSRGRLTRGCDLPRRAKAKPLRDGVEREQPPGNRPALPSKRKNERLGNTPRTAEIGTSSAAATERQLRPPARIRTIPPARRGQQPGATFILIHSDSFCLHFPQFSYVRRVFASRDYVQRLL
jgi:hypothetical protein